MSVMALFVSYIEAFLFLHDIGSYVLSFMLLILGVRKPIHEARKRGLSRRRAELYQLAIEGRLSMCDEHGSQSDKAFLFDTGYVRHSWGAGPYEELVPRWFCSIF